MSELNWNPDRLSCSRCRAELIPSNTDLVGSDDGVDITLRHLPCLACPEHHERAATSPDFGEALLEALFGDAAIPVVKRKGVVRKSSLCPRCGHGLEDATSVQSFNVAFCLRQPGRRHDVELEPVEDGSPAVNDPSVFIVELKGQGTTCESCGTRASAHGGGLTSPVRRAVVDAFESNLSGGR